MMKVGTWVVVASLVGACVTGERDPLGTDESAIIGGTRSLGTSATVLLAAYPTDRSVLDTCTAVVVSPTVLLTAAHCVDTPHHPGYLYGVFVGDDASVYANLAELEPHLASVASVHPHPQYSTQVPFYADIGVVVMAAPMTITPVPMQRTALDASVVGKAATIAGYGQTVYDTYNAKRFEASTSVGAVDNDTLVIGDASRHGCLGDSGGPALVDGTLVGIDSYGPVGCDGPAHYRRVDTFQPFIAQYVPPSSDPPGDPGMNPTDDVPDDTDGGGCSATRPSPAMLALLLALVLVVGRRRS